MSNEKELSRQFLFFCSLQKDEDWTFTIPAWRMWTNPGMENLLTFEFIHCQRNAAERASLTLLTAENFVPVRHSPQHLKE